MRRRRFVALGLAAIMAMTAMTWDAVEGHPRKQTVQQAAIKNRQKQPAEKKRLHFELDPDIRNPTHGSQRWKIIL